MDWKWETAADSQDGAIFSAYGGTSFPTMVLVGPDGTVMSRFSGEVETADPAQTETELEPGARPALPEAPPGPMAIENSGEPVLEGTVIIDEEQP